MTNPRIHLEDLLTRRQDLAPLAESIWSAYTVTEAAYASGKKLLLCGNGGSASDAEHIAGELLKGFLKRRPLDTALKQRIAEIGGAEGERIAGMLQQGIPAIPLVSQAAIGTAVINDIHGDMIFAQQVNALGQEGDVLWGLSTSGNSQNVVAAAIVAKARGMKVVAFTGEGGGALKAYADVLLNVPYSETYLVQEAHLPVYHALCAMLEERFFPV
ncbi:MAG: SIS domain-containing protein [Firmicutes bacterium]|jgi:D-sedoheptulose 7-phosphate isomerase|nr:SIS domain-containing protein [Bacillota bacterium]